MVTEKEYTVRMFFKSTA